MSLYYYTVGGLTLASTLELPSLLEIEPAPEPDVHISEGRVPEQLPKPTATGPTYQIQGDQFLLRVPETARYLVESGRRITVQAMPGTPPENVLLFLLGSSLGACYIQRGLVPLHASVVVKDGKAFAFTGPSGAGKSTLAAWLHYKHGFQLLCDDVCIIRFDLKGRPLVFPGAIQVKLWKDSVVALGKSTDVLSKAHRNLKKYTAPLNSTEQNSAPLHSIYLLKRSNSARPDGIFPIPPQQSVVLLREQSYRSIFHSGMAQTKNQYLHCVQLARCVQLYRFYRTTDHSLWPQTIDRLITHLETGIA